MLIGTAVRPEHLGESAYTATLGREFNLLEPEDALKWWVLHPRPDTYDFAPGDRLVHFAVEHGMKVRGHTLVWGRNNPDWLTEGHHTPKQLSQILHDHITTVVQHYRGKVFAWDVINEALDERGQLRSSLWYDQPGIGLADKDTTYIEQCFRWAHDADPDALLFYNDAEGEALNAKSGAIYAMVKDFLRRGVPIHGVGLQMHVENLRIDAASVAANIARLTALGLQVHITEMDVAIPVDAAGNLLHPEDLQRQADIYHQIATACLSHSGCTAIQTWGFTDKYSWIGSHSQKTKGSALPFDQSYKAKPAYEALLSSLASGR
jgi:endo-1,4-beta-xylanase